MDGQVKVVILNSILILGNKTIILMYEFYIVEVCFITTITLFY